jgi:hypothetical protein
MICHGRCQIIRTVHFFKNKKDCQAFAHAIDRKAIAALYGKMGRNATNFCLLFIM